MQNGASERNAGSPPERRIEFRIGVHLGDVVEEADGDLMGDGVNIAARLEGIAAPGASACRRTPIARSRGGLIGGQRSWPDPAQEHRRPDPGLIGCKPVARRGRSRRHPWLREVLGPCSTRRRNCGVAGRGRRRGVAARQRQSAGGRRDKGGNPGRATPVEAKRLSIVVLPFANLSNDPAQDYFADG